MQRTWLAVATVGLLLSSCGPDLANSNPCPAVVLPDSVTLNPRETAQISYSVFTCGGQQELEVSPVWQSANTAVATVSDTGLITAQLQGGNTTVTVSEAEYGTIATISVSVPIVDPIP